MAAPASQGSPSSTYTLSPSPRPHSARAKAFQEATFSGVPRQDSLGPVIKRLNWEKQQPGWGTARAVATGAAGGGGGEVTTSKTTPKTKKSSPKTKTKTKKKRMVEAEERVAVVEERVAAVEERVAAVEERISASAAVCYSSSERRMRNTLREGSSGGKAGVAEDK